MKKYINDGKQWISMRKLVFMFSLLLLATNSYALFGLFEKPVATVNHVTFATINQSQYGVSATENENISCAPIIFEMPYKQTYDQVYIKLGYFPLCDINQTDYAEDLTLYCQGQYVATYNVTDNCYDFGGAGTYEYEWLEINVNSTTGQSYSEGLSSVFSCYYCVNITSDIPTADFWIITENTGTKITVETETREVFPQLEVVVTLINDLLSFADSIIVLGIAIFSGYSFLWIIFATVLFGIFMFLQLKKQAKKLVK